jgi:GT2 family glycosyltransferase
MVKYFGEVRTIFATSNNIFQVRENCIRLAAEYPAGPPDYLLWLDSDNPPNALNFAHLWAAIQASPMISCIGGWYRWVDPIAETIRIAAGKMGEEYGNITEAEILKAADSQDIIQVPFIGFGMCLMKWKMIEDIGIEKCFEPYIYSPEEVRKCGRTWATDDSGFFRRASDKGHRTFLHPAVFLEHEKQMNVPASLERAKPILKELEV